SNDDPDRRFTIKVMNIEPGAPKRENLKRFIAALFSVTVHAKFLAARVKANYITPPAYRRLMSYAWLAIVMTVTALSEKRIEIVVGCVFPMTFLYQVSAMCQFVTEHLWAAPRLPGQSAREHYLSMLVNRHLGDPL